MGIDAQPDLFDQQDAIAHRIIGQNRHRIGHAEHRALPRTGETELVEPAVPDRQLLQR